MSRRLAVVAVAVCALLAGACGGGDDDGDAASNSTIGISDAPVGPATPTTVGSATTAPGRQTSAPWPAPSRGVRALIAKAGLPALPQEQLEYHLHSHLEVFVDGVAQTVPANLGIDLVEQVISPLHTHDESGVIHVENDKPTDFFLGQLFTEWDVRLDAQCVGSYCRDTKPWEIYVDGTKDTGNPARIQFTRHRQITIVIGKAPSRIPDKYDFPGGL